MTEFKTKLGNVGCHTINLGELLGQIDSQVLTVEGDKIKIPIDKVPVLLGITWTKLKETFRECEGKELVIEFGDTTSTNMIETLLKFLLELLPKAAATNA